MNYDKTKPEPVEKMNGGQTIILTLGLAVVFFGLLNLFRYGTVVFDMFVIFSETLRRWGWVILSIGVIYAYILPLIFIVGGAGFFFLKAWGRKLILIGLLADFLIELNGIITFWYLLFTGREYVIIPSGAPVTTNSVIPHYIILFLELIILYLLSSPEIKRQFKILEIENRLGFKS